MLFLLALIAALFAPSSAVLTKEQCTIIKNPAPIPPVGVINGNPARSLLIAQVCPRGHGRTIVGPARPARTAGSPGAILCARRGQGTGMRLPLHCKGRRRLLTPPPGAALLRLAAPFADHSTTLTRTRTTPTSVASRSTRACTRAHPCLVRCQPAAARRPSGQPLTPASPPSHSGQHGPGRSRGRVPH